MMPADEPEDLIPAQTDVLHLRVRHRLARLAQQVFAEAFGAAAPRFGDLDASIGDFGFDYVARPIQDNTGGIGLNDSFWLYLVARALEPRLIVESGVFKGHSTWLLHRGWPYARIESFDVDLSRIVHRNRRARLHGCDWTEVSLPKIDPDTSLAFFDDHVNQARRVREAHERGFRWLVFDDNLPAEHLFATGTPPVPTIDMLFDDKLDYGTEFEWLRKGKMRRYLYMEEDTFGAIPLIRKVTRLPDLHAITRWRPGSGMTLVELHSATSSTSPS